MKYGLTKHSRKENLTKDDIPTIFEPVIDTVQAISLHQQHFEECKVQRNSKHCGVGKEKQTKESTGNIWPASASANLSSINLHQIKSVQFYS